jgi:hypothetical protein
MAEAGIPASEGEMMRKLIAIIGTMAVLTVGLSLSASARTAPTDENQDNQGSSVTTQTPSAPKAKVKVEQKADVKGEQKNDESGSKAETEQGPGETGNHDGEWEHED